VGFGQVLCRGALNFVVYIHVERHLPAFLCLWIGLVPMQRNCDVRAAPVLRMFFGQARLSDSWSGSGTAPMRS
jgi:hypothetical protein